MVEKGSVSWWCSDADVRLIIATTAKGCCRYQCTLGSSRGQKVWTAFEREIICYIIIKVQWKRICWWGFVANAPSSLHRLPNAKYLYVVIPFFILGIMVWDGSASETTLTPNTIPYELTLQCFINALSFGAWRTSLLFFCQFVTHPKHLILQSVHQIIIYFRDLCQVPHSEHKPENVWKTTFVTWE